MANVGNNNAPPPLSNFYELLQSDIHLDKLTKTKSKKPLLNTGQEINHFRKQKEVINHVDDYENMYINEIKKITTEINENEITDEMLNNDIVYVIVNENKLFRMIEKKGNIFTATPIDLRSITSKMNTTSGFPKRYYLLSFDQIIKLQKVVRGMINRKKINTALLEPNVVMQGRQYFRTNVQPNLSKFANENKTNIQKRRNASSAFRRSMGLSNLQIIKEETNVQSGGAKKKKSVKKSKYESMTVTQLRELVKKKGKSIKKRDGSGFNTKAQLIAKLKRK